MGKMNAQQFESVSSWEMSDIWNFLLAFGEKNFVFTLLRERKERKMSNWELFKPPPCAHEYLCLSVFAAYTRDSVVLRSNFFNFFLLACVMIFFFLFRGCQHNRWCEIWMSVTAVRSHSFIGLFIYSTLLLLWCHLKWFPPT